MEDRTLYVITKGFGVDGWFTCVIVSTRFYSKYQSVLSKHSIRELYKYDIIMFDNVSVGQKNTNKVGSVVFDFRQKNIVSVF